MPRRCVARSQTLRLTTHLGDKADSRLSARTGWRDEQYTIYGPAPPPSPEGDDNPLQTGSNEAFRMERSACALFGFATFGVHCTGASESIALRVTFSCGREADDRKYGQRAAYVEEDGEPIKLWVPRRSATKQTCVSSATRLLSQ